jgi:hypothetical protein
MMATAKVTVSPTHICNSSNVEGLPGLVVGKEQIPRLLVFSQAARLQRRRHVEHGDVVVVMCQYSRQVMPPDGPRFDERPELGFSSSGSLRHGPCSHELPIHAPRTIEALPV